MFEYTNSFISVTLAKIFYESIQITLFASSNLRHIVNNASLIRITFFILPDFNNTMIIIYIHIIHTKKNPVFLKIN